MGRSRGLVVWIILVGILVLAIGSGVGSYNRLVTAQQAVLAQWGQVENVYQRRLDLVPNLVATVKGAAKFEQETFTQVAEARSRAASEVTRGTSPGQVITDPQALTRFDQAQQGLTSALSRLMVVVERYPDLHATEGFRELQTQLEGTENRIAVERMRFNEAAQRFNTLRDSFPTVLYASVFGGRFAEKAYFQAQPAAQTAPRVEM